MSDRRLDYLLLAAALAVIWQVLYWIAGQEALASPVDTVDRAIDLLSRASFWRHAGGTGLAFLYACAIALFGGLTIGLWLGFHRLSGDVADPILGTLYSIPKITLYPVILLVFGLGISAKIAFGALHGLFPVAIFAMNGVRKISPIHLRTARVLRLSPWATVTTVMMPAAVPEIVAGLRIGFSTTLLGILVGELFASTYGVGFILIRAMEAHNVADIMALTLLLFAFAATANGLLLLFERRTRHAG